jgi:hypothetical protein
VGSPGDLKLRHWVLIALPAVLCLAAWAAVQLCGGYQAVRLRGFQLERVSDSGQAEEMARKSIGLDFSTVQKAFNDQASWRLWDGPSPICDWGRRPALGAGGEIWMYEANSSECVFLFVEAGKVVGAGGD